MPPWSSHSALTAASWLLGALLQNCNRRQRLAFEELEKGAAGGGDVTDAIGDAELVDRGDRVTAACNRKGVRLGNGERECARAGGERVQLENADRAVPDDAARAGDDRPQREYALGADIENALTVAHVAGRLDAWRRPGRHF